MALMAVVAGTASAQKSIFMEMLENKKICNKEDQLTYFLQASSFERGNENRYYHRYAVGGKFFTTCIINENECYVIYQTDNARDYNDIKAAITPMCAKEFAADRSEYYVCNKGRIQDAEITFNGYLANDKVYEIKVFQDPEVHELPYSQADRVVPGSNNAPAGATKKNTRRKPVKSTATATAASVAPSKNATPAAAQQVIPAKPANPAPATAKPGVLPGVKPAPPVNVSKPKEATVKSVTPTPGKK